MVFSKGNLIELTSLDKDNVRPLPNQLELEQQQAHMVQTVQKDHPYKI